MLARRAYVTDVTSCRCAYLNAQFRFPPPARSGDHVKNCREAQFVGHADVINPEKMSDIVDASSRPENMEGSSIQAMGLPFACRRVTTPSHGLASTAAGEQQVDADWPDASMNEARIAQSCDLSPSQRARSARSWLFNSRSEVRR